VSKTCGRRGWLWRRRPRFGSSPFGDIVVFAKYGGTEIELDGEEYVILSERDLLAVVEK